jgi:FAD/FMN-containing dehydrogenase
MKRRDLLRTAAMLPLLTTGIGVASSARTCIESPVAKGVARRRVRPSDPQWPNAASWDRLKQSVGGSLVKVQPLFASCASEPKSTECLEDLKNKDNPFFIGDQPAGTQLSGWLDAWTPAASVYAVAARSSADVSAAVNFAREQHLRLVVKGGGHSYQGTSNAPDSLLVWTRAMNTVTQHDDFVCNGCPVQQKPTPAVTVGAGAMWIDVYDAVTTRGSRYVQGGGCTTVGVAGLVQSGGFGSMSKGFGTAAAGLLEAEIVTADGAVRTVNAYQNPDLYWALKGGGGGSWGVVTSLTLRTHAIPRFFGYFAGKIEAHSDAAFRLLIDRFVAFYHASLFNPHWGESAKIKPENILEVSMVCQDLSEQQIVEQWRPFISWVKASPQEFTLISPIHQGALSPKDWWGLADNPAMIRDPRANAPAHHGWWRGDQEQVGAFIHGYDSLWLPASLLKGDRQKKLANALFSASRHSEVELHFNKGLAGATTEVIAAARDTATNPQVLEAFALAIIANGGTPPASEQPFNRQGALDDARAVDRATTTLRAAAPQAGSYVSESNYFNEMWQQAFWGSHYQQLRAVKQKYDPDGLFFVHHGVGSELWSADGFTRCA